MPDLSLHANVALLLVIFLVILLMIFGFCCAFRCILIACAVWHG